MLTANPLRIKHFALMTYSPDNTGNLYRAEEGWRLRYPTDFFKNRQFLKKVRKKRAKKAPDYDAALPASLWSDIEEYLFVHRSHLIGADACDYVFRPARTPHTKKDKSSVGDPIKIHSLSALLKEHTRWYLKCPGFGPHAFRHIIATEYIKNHLNGYEVAAKILHESPEMVRERYAHLEHSDYFDHWVNYHEDRRESFRNGKLPEVEGK
jgi:integrase